MENIDEKLKELGIEVPEEMEDFKPYADAINSWVDTEDTLRSLLAQELFTSYAHKKTTYLLKCAALAMNVYKGDIDQKLLLAVKYGYKFPRAYIHSNIDDWKEVLIMGAKKHGANSWLNASGATADFVSMHNSMFHHLSEFEGGFRKDKESGLHPLLHFTCRALMVYVRMVRGIEKVETHG